MSTTPGFKANRTAQRRQVPIMTFDHFRIYRGSPKTIGDMKQERLIVKNVRRFNQGLPPKETYAEI